MWHWIDFRVGEVKGLLLSPVQLDVGDYNEMHVLMIKHHILVEEGLFIYLITSHICL